MQPFRTWRIFLQSLQEFFRDGGRHDDFQLDVRELLDVHRAPALVAVAFAGEDGVAVRADFADQLPQRFARELPTVDDAKPRRKIPLGGPLLDISIAGLVHSSLLPPLDGEFGLRGHFVGGRPDSHEPIPPEFLKSIFRLVIVSPSCSFGDTAFLQLMNYFPHVSGVRCESTSTSVAPQ